MRRHLPRTPKGALTLIAASVVLSSLTLARATAPSSQYALFGETNDAIVDVNTKLTWQRGHAPTTLSYAQAETYCANLVTTTPARTDYRLPSYRELLSLVDENPRFVSENGRVTKSSVDYNAFPDTQLDSDYWSSTPDVGGNGKRIAVNFSTGESTEQSNGNGLAVRCVAR